MKKKALVILHPGFEEIEAVTPIDLLARAEVHVVKAAIGDHLQVEGRSGITLQATHRLSEVIEEHFDAVILPGGPGIMQIRNHPEFCALLVRQKAAGNLIGCICAAPLLLRDAGLIDGLSYTAHPSTAAELPNASLEAVVQDGNIVTSRGAGTATEFALALVRSLTDGATTQTIADSICWPHRL
jgi:4-methyl-5(b-hydroxyethyl)-thiazole monophosphate biosynthesis